MATILQIDDEIETLKLTKEVLESDKHIVVGASSGIEGLKKLDENNKISLVLLDIMMPDMSGWDVYERIRQKNKKVKVAFLSVLECSEDKFAKLKKEGISDYIIKPYIPADLKKRVKAILS